MIRLFALPVAVLALVATQAGAAEVERYRSSIETLPASVRVQLKEGGFWAAGCPVPRWKLRLLTVRHWGFDGVARDGQLIVNRDAAAPLAKVFRRLYDLRYPIRHMQLDDFYGPKGGRPDDVTASFECRKAVPSPCNGGAVGTSWSNHAYGLALDVNPRENPYVGCGMTRDPTRKPYLDRSRLRKGMVSPPVVRAFASVGWGWGGSWSGQTKDYMHFSVTGH